MEDHCGLFLVLLSRKMDQVGVFVRSYMTRRVASCDQGQVFGEFTCTPWQAFLGGLSQFIGEDWDCKFPRACEH